MLFVAYGMTELSPIVTMSHAGDMFNGSVGVLIPNTQAKVRLTNLMHFNKEGTVTKKHLFL